MQEARTGVRVHPPVHRPLAEEGRALSVRWRNPAGPPAGLRADCVHRRSVSNPHRGDDGQTVHNQRLRD